MLVSEDFFSESERQIEELDLSFNRLSATSYLSVVLNEFFRHIHNIKSICSAYGLPQLVSFIHDYEDLLSVLRVNKTCMSPAVMELLMEGKEHIKNAIFSLKHGGEPKFCNQILVGKLRVISEEITKNKGKRPDGPLSHLCIELEKIVLDTAKLLGKKVIFFVEGDELQMKIEQVEKIRNVLVLLVKNAVMHNVESASQRQEKGKETIGKVKIAFSITDQQLSIEVSDDGAAANGAHLDLIRFNVDILSGTLSQKTMPGKACMFKITLPLTSELNNGMIEKKSINSRTA